MLAQSMPALSLSLCRSQAGERGALSQVNECVILFPSLFSFFLRSEANAMPQKGNRIGESGGLCSTAMMRALLWRSGTLVKRLVVAY